MTHSSPLLGLAGLLLATTATAQCYDPNLGTLVGTGDDVLFSAQPIGFAFPFGGATYTDCHISTNGWVAFSNAGTPAAPTSSYWNFGPTNLLASSPIISPLGHDLVATTSGVFINPLGTHTTITWDQVNEYSSSVAFTVQLALYPNGDFALSYGPNAQQIYTSNPCTIGIADGSTPADPGVTDISATTAFPNIFYELFDSGSLPLDIGNSTQFFTANPAGYDRAVLCEGAYNEEYGTGCTQVPILFYEHFLTGPTDLDGVTLTLTQNAAGGYDSNPAALSTFNTPTNNLGLGDSQVVDFTLPFTFDFPGGSTTEIRITDDGQLFLGAYGTYDWSNSTAELIATTNAAIFPAWFDMQPDPLAVENIYIDVISPTEVNITFLDVPRYPASYGDTEKFQVALIDDGVNDYVEIRYDHLMNDGSRGVHIGFTPGGATIDPGSSDLSAGTVACGGTELAPLALSASGAPVLGSTVAYTVGNIRYASGGFGLSTIFFSFDELAPTSLTFLGVNAPDCDLLIDHQMRQFSPPMFTVPNATFSNMVPNAPAWAGMSLYFQAVSLAPGENPTGVAVSNGVKSVWQAQ